MCSLVSVPCFMLERGVLILPCLANFHGFPILCPIESSPRLISSPNPDRTNWPKEDSAEMGIFLFPSPTTGLSTYQLMVQEVTARYFRQQGLKILNLELAHSGRAPALCPGNQGSSPVKNTFKNLVHILAVPASVSLH